MDRDSRASTRLSLWAAVAVGVALRVYWIDEQILADDEWHALHKALTASYRYLLTHFGTADYCIPLAVTYRVLLQTVGLSELTLRLPVLLSGIASLVVLPMLARKVCDAGVARSFAWLLAVSPMHVYFSRFARPYAPVLLLAFAGVLAAYRWWTAGGAWWRACYIASAVIASYLHLTVLPFVLAPIAFFGASHALDRSPGRRPRLLMLTGTALSIAALLCVLLLPPLIVDSRTLAARADTSSALTRGTWLGAIELWVGTGHLWVVGLLAPCLGVGVVLFARDRPRLLAYLTVLTVVELLAIALARPYLVNVALVFARYGIALLPVLLLMLATFVARAEDFLCKGASPVPAGLVPAAFGILLLALGPVLPPYRWPNNWTNHSVLQSHYGKREREAYIHACLQPVRIPQFYRDLARSPPGTLRIVEAPWYHEWHNNVYPVYQRIHRQWMAVGLIGREIGSRAVGELPAGDSRLRFRHLVPLSAMDDLATRGFDYVVLHRSLTSEYPSPLPRSAIDVDAWITRYREHFGNPVCDADGIVVFDVRRPQVSPR